MLLETPDIEAGAVAGSPDENRLAAWRRWLMSEAEHCSRSSNARATTGRVLLISYQFPPTGGSGVQRPAKLAKYLPSFGWGVEVLTAAHDRFPWSDPSLLEDIGSRCRIHRVAGLEPACLARRVVSPLRHFVPAARARWVEDRLYWRLARMTATLGRGDGESLWVSSAVRAALRLHGECAFDAMISTGPPHLAHRVALRVWRATGLPWIADVRDPLVSDFDRGPAVSSDTKAMRRLECELLRRATAVVTTCPSLAEDLRARYPERLPETIRSITNGFDRDDLRRALAGKDSCSEGFKKEFSHQQQEASHQRSSECVFVAAGSLYGRREISRIVEPLEQVLAAHPEWHGHVRLVLAGSIDGQQRRRWEQDRPEWLTLAGYVDHDSALRLAASAACNIVMVPDCDHGRLSVPGKLFELLALPTHVLALAPESGDTARIVQAAGGATVVPLEDAAGVASSLERIVDDQFAGRLARGREWSNVDGYDRRDIAARFADCLESARGGPR